MAPPDGSAPRATPSATTIQAEVEFVWVKPEGAVTLQGRLLDRATPAREARLVARRERDGARVGFPATVADERFEGRLDLGELPADGEGTDFWELYVDAGGLLRLAKRFDGVARKAAAMTYRTCRMGNRSVQPVFTDEGELSLRARPAGGRPAGAARPRALSRPIPPTERDVRLHLLALGIARRLIRRRAVAATGRPKVTILMSGAASMSGVARSVLNLAGHLAVSYDVEILDVVRRREDVFFDPPPGVRVTTVDDGRPGAGVGRGRLLRRVLMRFRGRLLHPADLTSRRATLWTDLLLVRHLRRIRSGAVISTRLSYNVLAAELARPGITAVGQEHMYLQRKRPVAQAAVRRHYGRLDAMAVLTQADRDDYEQFLDGATRVVAIPNAVSTLAGPPSDLTAPVVLAAGRLARQKGFDRLIPAFAEVARQEPQWTLRICGRGRQGPKLRRLIVEHEASNNVLMLGPVTDMARQMEQASLFVMASRFEGFPMVLIEAMSKGLPVVSFDIPTGPADIIEDGRTGFLVADGDVEAFEDAIVELIRDEPKRRRFGAAAAERATEFSLEKVGARWDALLADVGHPATAKPDAGGGPLRRVGGVRSRRAW
jgi:glycosyltransferase involved in cell wall biosynthesis